MNTHTGTAAWKHKLQLGDVFYNEDMTFEQRRDAIVERLRACPAIEDGPMGEELSELADALDMCVDPYEFDDYWNDVYDLADRRKWLWIDTFTVPAKLEES